jgi:5'-nucleotidase (lipoprotein e(P4) family)
MKKLIIVTILIMVASCATVKRTTVPEEVRSARTVTDQQATPAEGNYVQTVSEVTAVTAVDSCSLAARSQAVQDDEEDQDHLILATLWYQKSAEMRALYYQCFRNAEFALKANLEMQGRTGSAGEVILPETGAVNQPESPIIGGQAVSKPEGDSAGYFPHTGPVKPAAVVLDIDETLLDNSPFQGWQVLEKKSFNNDDWFRWVELARARPLPGAVEFTRYADSLGVEVFYVSNRTVQEMGPTIENMAAWGFVNADSTHMLLKETTSSKVERRALIEKDYEILLLVGDNLADHSGIYEKRGPDHGFVAVDADRKLFGTKYIVLPNPMYGNWLSELLKKTEGQTEKEKLLKLLETF